MIIGVEFNPVLVLELLGVLVLLADDRTFFFFICPVPKRNSLRAVSSESYNVTIVHRQIDSLHSVRMRVKVCSYWSSRDRIPDNKHRIITTISSYNKLFSIRACSGSNLITVTLKKLLIFSLVVINNTGMCWGVENLGSIFSSQIVHTLINIFVETNDMLKI